MLCKGDIVLVTSPISKYAGHTGIIKKLRKKSQKAIVKIFSFNADAWIELKDLIKITEKQKEDFEKI
jgi:hypothetical protein